MTLMEVIAHNYYSITFTDMLRLVLLIIVFLLSLLAVFRAPTYHLWLTAIVVTEFPLIGITITSGLLLWGYKVDKYVLPGTIIGVVALLILLSPIVRIIMLSPKLKEEMNVALGAVDQPTSQAPFSISKMITGIGAKQLESTTHFYDGRLTLDFYESQKSGKRPCVIVVHGGSWAGGDSKQLPELNTVLANEGYHVASINYQLAPDVKSPAQVEDVAKAMHYLREHAGELNIDTNQFVLLGRSAGAQITLVAAYTFHDPSIKGVVSFYGPADMIWGYSLPANKLVFDSRKVMVDYLGGTYEEVPQQYFNSSAIEFVTPRSPATLLIHGPIDPLVHYDHSTRLSAKLTKNHVPYYFLSLPCGTHGCDYTLNGPSGQLTTYSVLRFLKAVCK